MDAMRLVKPCAAIIAVVIAVCAAAPLSHGGGHHTAHEPKFCEQATACAPAPLVGLSVLPAPLAHGAVRVAPTSVFVGVEREAPASAVRRTVGSAAARAPPRA